MSVHTSDSGFVAGTYCLSIAYDCYVALGILICGDVESNLGFSTADILQNVLKGHADIHAEVTEMKNRFSECVQLIRDLDSRLKSLEQLMKESKESLPLITALQSSSLSLQNSVALQSRKLVDLEDRSRRSNIIVYGILENSGENEASLRKSVVGDIFEKKLGVKCESIARIHRLGRRAGRRPVIAYFQDFNEKQAVIQNTNKLKGTNIFIQYDYSHETLRVRKLLWDSAKVDRVNKKHVSLLHDKLKIDDTSLYGTIPEMNG